MTGIKIFEKRKKNSGHFCSTAKTFCDSGLLKNNGNQINGGSKKNSIKLITAEFFSPIPLFLQQIIGYNNTYTSPQCPCFLDLQIKTFFSFLIILVI